MKDPTSLEYYLCVQIVQSDNDKKAWLGQPTIIKSLEKQFGERVAKKKMTVTPGTPGFMGGKVDDISRVDEKTQSMYRSGVGTLLYLTKLSRPDITNVVRELSKSMDGASMAHVTEMYRVINFVLETKTLVLRMVPTFKNGIWKLEALSDSDFANDKDKKYRIYGYIIYFCGVPVAWKSKSIKSVVLSTTEAEYVASKSMDGASMAHVTEMYRVINFVLEMKTLGLRMVPIFQDGIWKLEALSDSDFANDKDTRYSVYGYIIYFCGIPVAWKSKSMKSVVLSTTEAEYVAVSEVVKEIKFLYQMLRSMEVKVPLPIKVHVDDVGTIWWQTTAVCQRGQSMLI